MFFRKKQNREGELSFFEQKIIFYNEAPEAQDAAKKARESRRDKNNRIFDEIFDEDDTKERLDQIKEGPRSINRAYFDQNSLYIYLSDKTYVAMEKRQEKLIGDINNPDKIQKFIYIEISNLDENLSTLKSAFDKKNLEEYPWIRSASFKKLKGGKVAISLFPNEFINFSDIEINESGFTNSIEISKFSKEEKANIAEVTAFKNLFKNPDSITLNWENKIMTGYLTPKNNDWSPVFEKLSDEDDKNALQVMQQKIHTIGINNGKINYISFYCDSRVSIQQLRAFRHLDSLYNSSFDIFDLQQFPKLEKIVLIISSTQGELHVLSPEEKKNWTYQKGFLVKKDHTTTGSVDLSEIIQLKKSLQNVKILSPEGLILNTTEDGTMTINITQDTYVTIEAMGMQLEFRLLYKLPVPTSQAPPPPPIRASQALPDPETSLEDDAPMPPPPPAPEGEALPEPPPPQGPVAADPEERIIPDEGMPSAVERSLKEPAPEPFYPPEPDPFYPPEKEPEPEPEFTTDELIAKMTNKEIQINKENVGKLEYLTVDFAAKIATIPGLYFHNLKKLAETDDEAIQVAGYLSRYLGLVLSLRGLTKLAETDEAAIQVATELAKFKERNLSLGGLTNISIGVAEALAGSQAAYLCLGLTDISPAVAEALAKFKGEILYLDELTTIDPEVAKNLAKTEAGWISLTGIEKIEFESLILLLQSEKLTKIDLKNLSYYYAFKNYSEEQKIELAKYIDKFYYFNNQSIYLDLYSHAPLIENFAPQNITKENFQEYDYKRVNINGQEYFMLPGSVRLIFLNLSTETWHSFKITDEKLTWNYSTFSQVLPYGTPKEDPKLIEYLKTQGITVNDTREPPPPAPPE